jgi:hypothetical protein
VKYVLLAHLAATLFMVGVIWFVQVVHYPLFSRIGPEKVSLYSEAHSRLTTHVVGSPMFVSITERVTAHSVPALQTDFVLRF